MRHTLPDLAAGRQLGIVQRADRARGDSALGYARKDSELGLQGRGGDVSHSL